VGSKPVQFQLVPQTNAAHDLVHCQKLRKNSQAAQCVQTLLPKSSLQQFFNTVVGYGPLCQLFSMITSTPFYSQSSHAVKSFLSSPFSGRSIIKVTAHKKGALSAN
jgi:BarA-like signal transduction histidine kinase